MLLQGVQLVDSFQSKSLLFLGSSGQWQSTARVLGPDSFCLMWVYSKEQSLLNDPLLGCLRLCQICKLYLLNPASSPFYLSQALPPINLFHLCLRICFWGEPADKHAEFRTQPCLRCGSSNVYKMTDPIICLSFCIT